MLHGPAPRSGFSHQQHIGSSVNGGAMVPTIRQQARVQAGANPNLSGDPACKLVLVPPAAPRTASGLVVPSRHAVPAPASGQAVQGAITNQGVSGPTSPSRRLIVPASAASSTLQPVAPVTQAPTSSLSAQYEHHTALWRPSDAPQFINGQRVHSLHAQGMDVIRSLTSWAQSDLLRYLKPVERSWQPAELLPDPASPDFIDQVAALRKASADLPFDYLVVLVGDMVTEEALPSYMNMLNTLDGTKDETGGQDQPWAHWTRHWTAEENRHGDLLNKYLYLSGRVDMRAIETTIQRLITSGLDPQLENNPYLCFIYTSFQERATKISHGNTARLAAYYGDTALTRICGLIAADEGRHENAYSAIVEQLFQRDPEGAVLAFADMMKKGIVMPAHFVDDGCHGANNGDANLFHDYATVADNIGVYTTTDYAKVVDHLVKRWGVEDLTGLSGEAAAAQEFLMGHSARIRRLAHIQAERRLRDRKRGRTRQASFSWVRGRQVPLN